MDLDIIYSEATAIINSDATIDERMLALCTLLNTKLDHYDWVGFYMVDPTEARMLELGPYVGAPTDHTRIPFGTGICGQAAETQETFIVPDVSKATNYLACSLTVKSEIVVPIMNGDTFLGELDIDSHKIDNFSDAHQMLLEQICDDLARVLK